MQDGDVTTIVFRFGIEDIPQSPLLLILMALQACLQKALLWLPTVLLAPHHAQGPGVVIFSPPPIHDPVLPASLSYTSAGFFNSLISASYLAEK